MSKEERDKLLATNLGLSHQFSNLRVHAVVRDNHVTALEELLKKNDTDLA